ncbi:MAG: small ribosomal subunit Rsm22 family protein [Terracidiphilus sp.]
MQLPADLREAISHALEGVSRTALSERAARISALYRTGAPSAIAVRDEADALAYAVSRLPATYAAVRHVLGRLQERCPDFRPRKLLDLGAGPGTASWAAVESFPRIETIAQIDSNQALLNLGIKLSESDSSSPLRNALRINADIVRKIEESLSAELVILSYTLAELARSAMEDALSGAWKQCTGALVIVEPGTPSGYERILRAREFATAQRAGILAPCPHQLKCPLVPPDWCHFVQRISRSRDHMIVKSADLSYEDEKFSYLIVVREHLFRPAEKNRILAQPQIGKAGFTAKLCTLAGRCESASIGRRNKQALKRARKIDWGDQLQPL